MDARWAPGKISRRLGHDLRRVPPFVAGGVVGAAGYVALAAVMLGLGALLTDVLLPGALQRWDTGVIRFLIRGRPDLDTASLVGSYLAEFATVLVVFGVMVAVSLVRGWRLLAAFLVVSISLEGLVYVTATYFVSRTRPPVPRLEELINSDSFPSGHVAASVVMWVCVAVFVWTATRNRPARVAAVVFAGVAPVLVALSRMYRGMHFPTDAMAGYLMGWGCLVVGALTIGTVVAVAEERRGADERVSARVADDAGEVRVPVSV